MTGLRRRPPVTDTVTVPCGVCKVDVTLTRDELRELVDNGGSPACNRGPRLCVPTEASVASTANQQQIPAGTRAAKLLTKSDKLMIRLVALLPGADSKAVARKGDLVLEAWYHDREAFGLPGHKQHHPDSNRVIMELVKLVRQKLVENPNPCEYRPTPFGRAYVNRLTSKES